MPAAKTSKQITARRQTLKDSKAKAERDALIAQDIFEGILTEREIAAKYGIGKSTVGSIKQRLKKNGTELEGLPQSEEYFRKLVRGYLGKSIEMLTVFADTCCDRDFVRGNPEGAVELGRFVCERADLFVNSVPKVTEPSK
jgi:hypothetical protein